MFLLDTNVISELRKAATGRAEPKVVSWAAAMPIGMFFLSAMTIMELEMGVLRLARRDAVQAGVLRAWLDGQVQPEFDGRVLPMDAAVALRCARLHVPDPRPERDAIIAATALVHGLTLVTRNTADFGGTGVAFINPWLTEARSPSRPAAPPA